MDTKMTTMLEVWGNFSKKDETDALGEGFSTITDQRGVEDVILEVLASDPRTS